MNIGYLKSLLSNNDEIAVLGKVIQINGVLCNVMGIVRKGLKIQLLILQYDEAFQISHQEMKALKLQGVPHIMETNRMILKRHRLEPVNPFGAVDKVTIGKTEFEVESLGHRRINDNDWKGIMLLTEFLRNGWNPEGIDYQDIDMMFLTTINLEGEYLKIPEFGLNPNLLFSMHPHCISHEIEQSMTLHVGDDYTERITFKDSVTEKEHWVRINRVYLADMWKDMKETFNNPKLLERMTEKEISEAKTEFKKKLSEICPEGMHFPVIEYECEEDITLTFYSKSYLDSQPKNSNSAIGFILRPDKPKGVLGLKLKAAIIQEPVHADTKIIDAELFSYNVHTKGSDIILSE